ncbi:hypothetical protein F383_32692 [Gossypium arboreum]|uniref:Uncharacterized protein n=1 Tax=Gossypium arboreum TaxID=29729 RepID=A0A0B0N0C5_GOSAR|nr:hypothetical protein F383_32692 [Gossypium arboreum]
MRQRVSNWCVLVGYVYSSEFELC